MELTTLEQRRRARAARRRAAREREQRIEALMECVVLPVMIIACWAMFWVAGWLALSMGVI